jgi:hypothetical protein
MAKRGPKPTKKVEEKRAFDVSKNYEWQQTTTFTLTGIEFSIIYSTLKELALSPTGTSAHSAVTAFNAIHAKLVLGIEEGVVTEAKPPDEQPK